MRLLMDSIFIFNSQLKFFYIKEERTSDKNNETQKWLRNR